jgi:hypothetical protein
VVTVSGTPALAAASVPTDLADAVRAAVRLVSAPSAMAWDMVGSAVGVDGAKRNPF